MKNKSYAVLGLGRFGKSVALTLDSMNKEVIAIDNNMNSLNEISSEIQNCICLDTTDIRKLKEAGVGDVDVAVVSIGDSLEESILTVLNLKELGVPYVIAKAKNEKHEHVLLKCGASEVIKPEKEMGLRLAKRLSLESVMNVFDLDAKYSMIELRTPRKWQGKSLSELDLRKKTGILVVGKKENGNLLPNISPDYNFTKDDVLVIIASKGQIASLK